MVITEKIAKKYFGDTNPIGQTFTMNNNLEFAVSAVIADVPDNSSIKFQFVAPFKSLEEFGYQVEGWNSYAFPTFVLLNENVDYKILSGKIADEVKKYDEESIVSLSLQPITDMYLRSGDMSSSDSGDIRYIYIFSIIGGLVLLIACINFMNLATAKASTRAREIGLRKVVGAGRKNIISQFYGESIFFAVISLGFSLVLIEFVLPLFNKISGKDLSFSYIGNSNIVLLLIGVVILTGIVSGSYPAIFLSAFKPVRVLKGNLKSGAKSHIFRKILVSIQFVFTIALLISAIVVNSQLKHIQNKKLGFDKDHILYVKLKGDLNQKTEFLKTELKKNPNVISATAVGNLPALFNQSSIIDQWEGSTPDDKILSYLCSTDEDYIQTMNIDMVEGRYFSKEFAHSDSVEGIVINQTAAELLGFESPVGKRVFGTNVIGVIKDFNFKSLHSKIQPLVLFDEVASYKFLLIKVGPENITRTITDLQKLWKTAVPDFPVEFNFLDEKIDQIYKNDLRIQEIMNSFTLIALFIACMGLFGLALFTAEQRTNEIGIRKALGASITGIIVLLSKEFTKYVLLANIIAWPIAWFAMEKFLQNYAYRIDLNHWVFLSAGVSVFIIAILTVSFQAVKAALADPVKSLRYE